MMLKIINRLQPQADRIIAEEQAVLMKDRSMISSYLVRTNIQPKNTMRET